jgi:hypothetical protein
MEKPIETIEIDDKTRYALYPDTETWDYLREYDWEGLGVFTITNDRNCRPLALDALGLNSRLETINDSYFIGDKQEAMAKAITRAGYSYKFVTLRDYPSYWHEVVIYWDENTIRSIDGVIDELEAWYCGNVYTVALETLETYTGTYRNIEQWEVTDSIGRILFTDSYKFDYANCDDLLGDRRAA